MTSVLHIRVTDDLRFKIEELAERKGRTVSDLVRELITFEANRDLLITRLDRQDQILDQILKACLHNYFSLPEFIRMEGDTEKADRLVLQTRALAREKYDSILVQLAAGVRNDPVE